MMKARYPRFLSRRLSGLFAATTLLAGSHVLCADAVAGPQKPLRDSMTAQAQDARPVGFDRVYGDSIAFGMQGATGLPGDTEGGRSPAEILAALEKENPALIRGAHILLTTGTGNDPSLMEEYVPRQLALLKEHGAAHVVVMGLSRNREDISGRAYSRRIQAMVRAAGTGFHYGGMYTADGGDKIHMTSAMEYRTLYRQALGKLSRVTRRPALPVFDVAAGGREALALREASGCSAFMGRGGSLHSLKEKMTRMGGAYYKGRNVILTGAASYGADFAKVAPDLIDMLKKSGAAVVLAGAPVSRKDAWAVNKRLEKLAREKNVAFTGPLPLKPEARLRRGAEALLEKRLADATATQERAAAPRVSTPPGTDI